MRNAHLNFAIASLWLPLLIPTLSFALDIGETVHWALLFCLSFVWILSYAILRHIGTPIYYFSLTICVFVVLFSITNIITNSELVQSFIFFVSLLGSTFLSTLMIKHMVNRGLFILSILNFVVVYIIIMIQALLAILFLLIFSFIFEFFIFSLGVLFTAFIFAWMFKRRILFFQDIEPYSINPIIYFILFLYYIIIFLLYTF